MTTQENGCVTGSIHDQENNTHSFPFSEITGHRKTATEDQGLSFAQVKTLEGNFSFCTEIRHRASPFQG